MDYYKNFAVRWNEWSNWQEFRRGQEIRTRTCWSHLGVGSVYCPGSNKGYRVLRRHSINSNEFSKSALSIL